jgi:hypothetical protein
MRSIIPYSIELGRLFHPEYPRSGPIGAFQIQGPCGSRLRIISSNDYGWEHVSVSLERRLPNWTEMCFVKNIFWEDEERVIQYHPPKSEYVNNCKYCLHLWKPIGVELPYPPAMLVGIASLGVLK